jgi:hypothetical protein
MKYIFLIVEVNLHQVDVPCTLNILSDGFISQSSPTGGNLELLFSEGFFHFL